MDRYNFILPNMVNIKARMIDAFRELVISSPADGDRFFEDYSPGNTIDLVNQPSERFHDYEIMLLILLEVDADKYKSIHKGTPFYFMGWLAFDMRNYESAMFYMSAALAEDKRKSVGQPFEAWINNPAGQFFSLDQGDQSSYVTSILAAFINNAIYLFKTNNPDFDITPEIFIDKFTRTMLKEELYSFVTAVYTFIMEYEELYINLILTNMNINSLEPILLNLFKGALIFESLLKHYYPNQNNGIPVRQISHFSHNSAFCSDFSGCRMSQTKNTLIEIINEVAGLDYKSTFETTAKLRNTTGHKLLWDNVFSDITNYKKLYEQEIMAILYVITKQWT